MNYIRIKYAAIVMISITMTACDMLESGHYDVHITGEQHLTNKNIELIELPNRLCRNRMYGILY
ncbi:MAG: hypothetical protein HDR88_17470 [Bacteroides sp.]|nr:hypothetical protein [Bacteroides sp.]